MEQSKWPARAVLPVAVPGLKYIFFAALVTGGLFYFGWTVPAWVCLGLTCFTTWFFRDPDRTPPDEANSLISPADGRVILVEKQDNSQYVQGPCLKVSIFMNVFNVHVNRIPFDGVVEQVAYHPGKFINASFDKASEHNERNALVIKTSGDHIFAVVQVAGLIARRIVNCVKAGEKVVKGERYGMIQFGSRLDLYLPVDFQAAVKPGDITRAGTTVIGYMN